jgi:hypothetical protein
MTWWQIVGFTNYGYQEAYGNGSITNSDISDIFTLVIEADREEDALNRFVELAYVYREDGNWETIQKFLVNMVDSETNELSLDERHGYRSGDHFDDLIEIEDPDPEYRDYRRLYIRRNKVSKMYDDMTAEGINWDDSGEHVGLFIANHHGDLVTLLQRVNRLKPSWFRISPAISDTAMTVTKSSRR